MAEFEKKGPQDTEEYEPEIIDLDGEPFEIIDGITHGGANYLALVPYIEDLDDDDDAIEFIILKEEEKDGEFFLATIDDDNLYSEIGDMFIEHFESLDDEE
ncbi:MAG: DUF1292 domain-containing protein [Eubacterium sp.]|nr:DUF1292 domain-containing protein [Eubacterium sp.]